MVMQTARSDSVRQHIQIASAPPSSNIKARCSPALYSIQYIYPSLPAHSPATQQEFVRKVHLTHMLPFSPRPPSFAYSEAAARNSYWSWEMCDPIKYIWASALHISTTYLKLESCKIQPRLFGSAAAKAVSDLTASFIALFVQSGLPARSAHFLTSLSKFIIEFLQALAPVHPTIAICRSTAVWQNRAATGTLSSLHQAFCIPL